MNYDLKDDLISEKWLEDIQFNLTSNIFSWFLEPNLNSDTTDLNNFCLIHTFFNDDRINSDHFFRLNPLLDKIKMSKLIKVKANLYPKTDKIVEQSKSIGFNTKGKTALFYVNQNDGFTNLNNEIKIESKKNRLLTFDNQMMYGESTCSNNKYRLTIDINYIE